MHINLYIQIKKWERIQPDSQIILPPWNKILCFKEGSKKKKKKIGFRAELLPAIMRGDCYIFKTVS